MRPPTSAQLIYFRRYFQCATMRRFALIVICCVFHCSSFVPRGLSRRVLSFSNDPWIVKNANNSFRFEGTVPGGVYTDLSKAGILNESIYYRFNDVQYRWVAHENWTYSINFTVAELDPKKSYELVFHGLDGLAVILLNGQNIGKAVNTFIRYRFSVTGLLNQGFNNVLEVKFESPIVSGQRFAAQSNHTIPPNCNPPDYHGECHVNYLRRMPASYGWDWGLAVPSVGIWKPVELVAHHPQDLSIRDVKTSITSSDNQVWKLSIEVYCETTLQMNANVKGQFQVKLHLENDEVIEVTESATFNSSSKDADRMHKFVLNVPKAKVKLWWPNGYGEQHLYNLTVTFENLHGSDNKTVRIGFREAKLFQDYVNATHPEFGRSFYFAVNGVQIFAKGLNYIPHSIFLEEAANRETITSLLSAVHEANMNMVRVWGGGIYADDFFYEECDRLGIMVWQDMMFACSLYPTDAAFLSNVRDEIGQQIRRLQHHPSIVVWAGNNENEAGLRGNWYNTKKDFALYKKEYIELYVDTVEEEVLRNDDTRPFLVSSPSNGVQSEAEGYIAKDPYDPLYGDVHYYYYLSNSWLSDDYPLARFSSEYGFQSLPSLTSLRKVAAKEDLQSFNTEFFRHRQHQPLGYVYLMYQMLLQFGPPNLDDLNRVIYLSQINQAWAVKQQTEWYRKWRTNLLPDGRGQTMGAMYWQLNDVWQAPSWSSIEFDGKWKMLHYYAKKFFSPMIVTAHMKYNGDISISLVSDLLQDKPDVEFKMMVFVWNSWTPVSTTKKILTVKKESAVEIFDTSVENLAKSNKVCQKKHSKCFMKFNLTDTKSRELIHENFLFLTPLRLANDLKPSIVQADVKSCSEKLCTLSVKASTISLFVWLDANEIRGHFSENGFIMTEPEKEVQFYAQSSLSIDQLRTSLSIVVYNDF